MKDCFEPDTSKTGPIEPIPIQVTILTAACPGSESADQFPTANWSWLHQQLHHGLLTSFRSNPSRGRVTLCGIATA
jgi:hypothetical protein